MITAFLVILFTSLFKPAIAQNITSTPNLFSQYQTDYFYQRDIYQKSLDNFNEKLQIDNKYSSVTTQNDKFLALKETLKNRNIMLKSYLMALRVSLDDSKASNFNDTETVQNNLRLLEQWLTDQNQIISTSNNLTDLKNWAAIFKTKYIDIQKTAYTALVQNEVNLDLKTLNDINDLTTQIQSQPQIKEEDKHLIDEIRNTSDSVSTSLKTAYGFTQNTKNITYKYNDFYPDAKSELNKAKSNLSAMFSNLKIVFNKMNN